MKFNFKNILLFFLLVLFQSCFMYGKKDILSLTSKIKEKTALGLTVSSVNVSNNLVTINGSNFSKVTQVSIENNSGTIALTLQSISDSQIIASASSALSLAVNQSMNLIIANAEAQATFPITFTIPNETITTSHLSKSGASAGDVMKYNGTNWVLSHISSSQTYLGTWSANLSGTGLEASPYAGDYYIVSSAGNYNDGSSTISFAVGDWIMYSETSGKWEKVVSGVSARVSKTGDTMTGDLVLDTLLKLKGASNYVTLKASSSLSSDIVLTLPTSTGTNGQVLTTDGNGVLSWTTVSGGASGTAGGDLTGTYPNPTITGLSATKIGSGTVDNTKFGYLANVTSDIQAQLNANTANSATNTNTVSTIVKRDASGNFSAGTITATLNGTATNVTGTVAVANGGTGATTASGARTSLGLGTASTYDYVGCLTSEASVFYTGTGWTCVTKADATKLPLTGGTLSGALAMGSNKITGLSDPSSAQDAATKTYVDTQVASGTNQWTASSGNVYRSSGNVGIGTSTPTGILHINTPGATPNILLSRTGNVTSFATRVSNNGSNDVLMIVNNTDNNKGIHIESTGNVGIGTTTPGSALEVNAPVTTFGSNQFKITDGTTGGYFSVSEGASGASVYLPQFSFASAGVGGYGGSLLGMIPSANDTLVAAGGAILLDGRTTTGTALTNANILNIRNNGSSLMTVTAAGNVGIGTTSPSQKLEVAGNIYANSTYTCTMGNASGSVSCSSDERLKKNIEEIKDPIEKILKIRGVTFDWKDGRNKKIKDIGVIAQEIEKVFPSVVHLDPKGFKSVDYGSLVSPLIEAFKELNKRFTSFYGEFKVVVARVVKVESDNVEQGRAIASLKNEKDAQVKKLEEENALLKARLEKIEKMLEKKK